MSREGTNSRPGSEEDENPFHGEARGFNPNAYISRAAHLGLQRAVCQEFGRINDTLGALQESIADRKSVV